MIATMLARPRETPAAAAQVWRQLIDLLAQGRDDGRGWAAVAALGPGVPVAVRTAAAAAVAEGRAVPERLVALLAADVPEVAGPLLSRIVLPIDAWRRLMPHFSPFARGQVRARPDVAEALARGRDLPAAAAAAASAPVVSVPAAVPAPIATAGSVADRLRFTTDAAGAIRLRGGGHDLALAASLARRSAGEGVDDPALDAWHARAAFADATLIVADGLAAGLWRLSGEPCFAAPDGRFVGYAGEAQRRRTEAGAPLPAAPAAPAAATIDAGRLAALLAAVAGPLDLAAAGAGAEAGAPVDRPAEPAPPLPPDQRRDAAAILGRLHAACRARADDRGVALSFRIAAGLPPIAADAGAVERMVSRLLTAAIGIAAAGECVAVRVGLDRRQGSQVAIALSRPGALAGLDERQLVSPPAEAETGLPHPGRLALAFAIRLVRGLATDAGGRLDLAADRLVLSLPLAAVALGAGDPVSYPGEAGGL
ncbi:MAG: hypothetical protein PGN09_10880 [Sphingomonas fennica]